MRSNSKLASGSVLQAAGSMPLEERHSIGFLLQTYSSSPVLAPGALARVRHAPLILKRLASQRVRVNQGIYLNMQSVPQSKKDEGRKSDAKIAGFNVEPTCFLKDHILLQTGSVIDSSNSHIASEP
jgi:hypothetical protein